MRREHPKENPMKHLIKTVNDTRGFTLIEAMISLFVISIGLLAITRMQIGSINGNATAMDTLRASVEMNANADLLQSMDSTDLADGDTVTLTSPDGTKTTTYTVTDVTLFSGETYKSIDVATTWNDRTGHQKSIQSTITKLPTY